MRAIIGTNPREEEVILQGTKNDVAYFVEMDGTGFQGSVDNRGYVVVGTGADPIWVAPLTAQRLAQLAVLAVRVHSVAPRRPHKMCGPGKIVNPKTGRCVNADGPIGKALRGSGSNPRAPPGYKRLSYKQAHSRLGKVITAFVPSVGKTPITLLRFDRATGDLVYLLRGEEEHAHVLPGGNMAVGTGSTPIYARAD